MLKVLDINIFDQNIPSAINLISDQITLGKRNNLCISATGAHGIIEAQKNIAFKDILNSFFINLPDGMPTVWVGKLKGFKSIKRCYGPDFFEALLKSTANKPINHFFCGGKEGVAVALKHACHINLSNENICGTFCPPFRELSDNEMKELANQMNAAGADIIWIGLSTPKQEIFAARLSNFLNAYFIITVGAAFDFHTGNLRQAPKWVQNSGLEWFFRLIMEPKRLYKRYFEIVPQFLWLNIKEFVDFCIIKNVVK